MEVQQEPGHAAAGMGGLPPAPHGAASVMATLMTDNNEAQSEGDTEMEQQAASGPSRSAAAAQVRSVSSADTHCTALLWPKVLQAGVATAADNAVCGLATAAGELLAWHVSLQLVALHSTFCSRSVRCHGQWQSLQPPPLTTPAHAAP